MKKIITVVFAILIIVTTVLTAHATSSATMTFSSSKNTVNRGDTITITVSISTVDNCKSAGFAHKYDTNIFEFVSGMCTLSGTSIGSVNDKAATFAYSSGTTVSGQIFTYTLRVKDTAAYGTYTISGVANSRDTSGAISTSSSSTSITIGCKHSYSNSCDTSCNSCGATRSISHSWNSGSYSQKPTCTAGGTKVYTCKVCGTTKSESVSKSSHTYDNDCDASCNVCGNERSINHSYSWQPDGDGHIEKCSVCGATQSKGSHTLETEAGSNESGHGYKCSVCGLIPDAQAHKYDSDCDATCGECGYVRTVTHAYNEKAMYDADAHWYVCMICGETTEKASHEPGEKPTETTDQLCTTCGYVIQRGGSHAHKESGIWHSNDVGHWTHCACLVYFDPEAHVLGEGITNEEENTISYECQICKHVITKQIPEETVPEDTIPIPTEPVEIKPAEKSFYGIPLWFIFACGFGVSLIANIIFIICVSRKKKGHFSR